MPRLANAGVWEVDVMGMAVGEEDHLRMGMLIMQLLGQEVLDI